MADTQRIGIDEVVRHFEELEDPRSEVNLRHPLLRAVYKRVADCENKGRRTREEMEWQWTRRILPWHPTR